MECQHARDSISARVDGEFPPSLDAPLDHHLTSCTNCRAWEDDAYALRRSLSLRQAGPPPDLADHVLARLSIPEVGSGQWVRIALGVVAAMIVIFNAPLLVGSAGGIALHESRHLGTFGVALGIGLLWAAVRPERANGLLPLVGALAATTVIGTIIDLAGGQAQALGEAGHTLELAGIALLWTLSGGRRRLVEQGRVWRRRSALRAV